MKKWLHILICGAVLAAGCWAIQSITASLYGRFTVLEEFARVLKYSRTLRTLFTCFAQDTMEKNQKNWFGQNSLERRFLVEILV
jgi:hypothetical protein